VVLDAGHGGVDSGAVYDGVQEKDITLDVTLLVRYYLVQRGIYVELTRDTDKDVSGWDKYQKGRHRRDLQGRIGIINKGTVGVSIHVNMSTTPNEQGAMVFYAQGSTEGERLGKCILDELSKVQTLNHRETIARTNLYLLRSAGVPVVLVELGFLSSPVDREKLQDSEKRKDIAKAIATGILRYFDIEV
jgi:N-acetylmuramoyl-L-alanine amidase